ncbi:hypothetical protein DOE63_31375 [Salmonella enterica subsp. diarizonae serovar 59:z10:-]|nr:hypothetical protein DOE63_31375 [Salmonella enterica subsp. diarizonae serovar 59:z10:-]
MEIFMPLRATLDNEPIQSFNLDFDEWASLKETYKDKSLLMPCCQRKAIPKTSKLGTQYFAHSKRGDCTSSPETQEHIYLKFLIAKVAQEHGWHVITEYAGNTPDGEEWIADVFCKKGNANLAFEVQWSHQTNDEYLRRTQKYTSSGVRCAWLFRLKGNKEYYRGDFIESYNLPYFGFRHKDGEYVVARYNTSVAEFVGGMFEGKLAWLPKQNEPLVVHVCYTPDKCWKCKKPINIVTSLDIHNKDNALIESLSFTDKSVAHWIANYIPKQILWNNGIGTIMERYSKTVGGKYMSNGCVHCDALQGNFFVATELGYGNNYLTYQWKYNPSEISIEESWFFNGKIGKPFY